MSVIDDLTLMRYQVIRGQRPLPDDSDVFLACYYAIHGDVQTFMRMKPALKVTDQYDSDDSEQDRVMRCILDGVHYDGTDCMDTCIAYAIMFNLEVAYWWYDTRPPMLHDARRFVSAKLIMNNDLRYVTPDVFCIWYPDRPTETTYRTLYTQHPELAPVIAHGCVQLGYNTLYKELDVLPDGSDISIARRTGNNELADYILLKARTKGVWKVLDHAHGQLQHGGPHPGIVDDESLTRTQAHSLYQEGTRCRLGPHTPLLRASMFIVDDAEGAQVDPLWNLSIVQPSLVDNELNYIDEIVGVTA